MNNLNVQTAITPRSSHPLMWTRRQDVFKKPSASFSVPASRISLSAKLLCKCSAQTLSHSQFMLIARTPTHQNLSTTSLFLSPCSKTVILSPTTQKYVFIIPFRTLLMVCASWYVWSCMSLPGQTVIYSAEDNLYGLSLQHSSSRLVILPTTGTRGSQHAASCFNTYYRRVSGTNVCKP